MNSYSREDAVPRRQADDAIAALEAAGYESKLTADPPRDEHPGHVVIASRLQLEGDDAGRRNLDDGHAALRDAGVEFHHYDYGHGTVIAGGPGHRWVEMRGADGERLGIKALAHTAELEQAVGRAALAGSELEELTADFVHLLAWVRPAVGRVLTDERHHAALIRWARGLAKVQITDAGLAEDFSEWLADVDKARVDRNILVHSTTTVVADPPASARDRPSIAGPALIRRRERSPRPFDPAQWDDLIQRMNVLLRDGHGLLRRLAESMEEA